MTMRLIEPRRVALVAMLLDVSCTAELAGGDPLQEQEDVANDVSTAARLEFDETVMPRLEARCRFCHGDPAMAPAFLVGSPDPYPTVKSWPSLVVLAEPGQSRLLTKGDHDGPPWTEGEAADVLAWIVLEQREALALPGEPAAPEEGAAEVDERCADLAVFSTTAGPALEEHCASCHAGADAPATASLDLSGVGQTVAACGRVISQIDLVDPMRSALFTEVDPLAEETHPFRFGGDYTAFRTFRTEVLQWVLDREPSP